jgi:hypothetical protein
MVNAMKPFIAIFALCLLAASQTMQQAVVNIPAPAAAGGPTLAYVAAASGSNTSGSTSCAVSVTYTSTNQLAIAVLVDAYVNVNVSGFTLSMTGDGTNTYTQFSTSPFADASTFSKTAYWWTKPSTTGAKTVTMTSSSSAANLNCYVITWSSSSGWKAAPVDKQATASVAAINPEAVCGTNTNTFSSGTTATTAQATELAIGIFAMAGGSGSDTWAAGTGYTQRFTGALAGEGSQVEDQSLSATGAQTATSLVCAASTGQLTTGGAGIVLTLMPN